MPPWLGILPIPFLRFSTWRFKWYFQQHLSLVFARAFGWLPHSYVSLFSLLSFLASIFYALLHLSVKWSYNVIIRCILVIGLYRPMRYYAPITGISTLLPSSSHFRSHEEGCVTSFQPWSSGICGYITFVWHMSLSFQWSDYYNVITFYQTVNTQCCSAMFVPVNSNGIYVWFLHSY